MKAEQEKQYKGQSGRKDADEQYSKAPATRFREIFDFGLKINGRTYSQKELAELIEIHPQTIQAWANGMSLPNAGHLITLHKKTGINVDWLLGLSNSETILDMDIVKAAKTLGINDKAAKAIRDNTVTKKHKAIFNALFEALEFNKFFNACNSYMEAVEGAHTFWNKHFKSEKYDEDFIGGDSTDKDITFTKDDKTVRLILAGKAGADLAKAVADYVVEQNESSSIKKPRKTKKTMK